MKELSKECKEAIGTEWERTTRMFHEGVNPTAFNLGAVSALTNPSIYSLAGLSPSLEWIPVSKNSKPPIGEYVLLYNGHWRGVGKFNPKEDEDDFEPEWQDETSEYITPIPTHWMPLPAKPKQQ